ncbi:hypothetical protein [Actinophytocola sp.]|uniref:hypothetical protein n=1 Tax=Actinophytocola sp. TaxID=1872138 RepID=UPI003D6BA62C
MSEKSDTDSIRFTQVLAGAMAAVTAAVLGSTMGVAGTVVGAGLASVITTVGGALYLRSIQRTKQSVRTVRNLVVTRAGPTRVTLVEEKAEPEPEAPAAAGAAPDHEAETLTENEEEAGEDESDQPPARRRLRWPALIAASVLAFVVGMLVVTGVEWVRGEPLSGGNGTTVGGIVRQQPDEGGVRDDAPAPTRESTTPPATETVTVTPPPAGEGEEPTDPPSEPGEPSEPGTSPPSTTTGAEPTGSVPVPVPPTGQSG